MILIGAYSLLALVYSVFLMRLWAHWKKADELVSKKGVEYSASVIIPVKNEVQHIEVLLSDMDRQKGVEGLEVIVVDDHSTDATLEMCRDFKPENIRLQALSLPEGREGKKSAINHGIEHSSGEIILTTDGDCRLGTEWASSMLSAFSPEIDFVSGPVKYSSSESWFSKILKMEFVSLTGVGGAMLNAGIPGMCNGANLAFRKDTFHSVGGYSGNDSIPTGDDEFLLRKIWNNKKDSAIFLKNRKAIVTTSPPESASVFFQQRKRWASKWKRHRDLKTIGLGVFIFIFYLLQLLGVIHLIINPNNTWNALFLFFLAFRITADWVFLRSAMTFYVEPISIRAFMLLQFIYPFYSLIFGLAANFGKYNWKGGSYKV